jgi:hypothetical protein
MFVEECNLFQKPGFMYPMSILKDIVYNFRFLICRHVDRVSVFVEYVPPCIVLMMMAYYNGMAI